MQIQTNLHRYSPIRNTHMSEALWKTATAHKVTTTIIATAVDSRIVVLESNLVALVLTDGAQTNYDDEEGIIGAEAQLQKKLIALRSYSQLLAELARRNPSRGPKAGWPRT